MDMKVRPHLRVGIGQGFLRETETPKLVVRIRAGRDARKGNYVGDEDRPLAFVWSDDAAPAPDRDLVVRADLAGEFLWEGAKPVRLRDLFPKDKALGRLEGRLEDWQRFLAKHYNPRTPGRFYWGRFNDDGRQLARRLQAELIDRAVIRYCRPVQDPQSRFAPEIAL